MSLVTSFFLVLLPLAANAGDLWLSADSAEVGQRLSLQVPANWLLNEDGPVEITVDGAVIDLRDAARDLLDRPVGARRVLLVDTDEGQDLRLVLEHRARPGGSPALSQSIDVLLLGADGSELGFTVPFEGTLGRMAFQATADGFSANVRATGVSVPWSDHAFLDQLRHSPPVTLLDATGEDGQAVRIATR